MSDQYQPEFGDPIEWPADAAPPLMPGGESTSARLRRVETERDKATRLLEYALHLRQHGERAPGGDETWAEFDRRAEDFLRDLPIRPTPHLDAVVRERDELRQEVADLNTAFTLAGGSRNFNRNRALKAEAELEQERDKAARYGAAYRRVCTMLAAAVQQRDALAAHAETLARGLTDAHAELARLRDRLAGQSTTDKEPTE